MADDKSTPKTRTVYLIGKQRGGEHGDKRVLAAADAATLVDNGHARYATDK